MTFTLRHPSASAPHVYALYGYDPDPKRGYWAEVREERHTVRSYAVVIQDHVEFDVRGRLVAVYNARTPGYDTVKPVVGLLRFLSGAGFVDLTDVEQAIDIIAARGLEGLPPRLTRIGSILRNLEAGLV